MCLVFIGCGGEGNKTRTRTAAPTTRFSFKLRLLSTLALERTMLRKYFGLLLLGRVKNSEIVLFFGRHSNLTHSIDGSAALTSPHWYMRQTDRQLANFE